MGDESLGLRLAGQTDMDRIGQDLGSGQSYPAHKHRTAPHRTASCASLYSNVTVDGERGRGRLFLLNCCSLERSEWFIQLFVHHKSRNVKKKQLAALQKKKKNNNI